jgi:DnaJ domain/ATP synthase I chain
MSEFLTPDLDTAAESPAPSGVDDGGPASHFTSDLDAPPFPSGQSDASGIAFAAIITGAAVLAIVALISGLMGSPQFSIGLGLGVAAGVVPYLIFVVIHAVSSEARGERRQRRHMTQEEWERVFSHEPRAGAGAGPDRAHSWTNTPPNTPSEAETKAVLQSAYDLLGVTPDAGSREVRSAYHRMAQLHHPDKVAHEGEEAQAEAERLMRELNAAYALIRESRKRPVSSVPA